MSLAYSELSEQAGISPSYANEILSGARTPSRSLAIHIFRKTGWRHALLEGLNDDEIALLEKIDPWEPSAKRTASAA